MRKEKISYVTLGGLVVLTIVITIVGSQVVKLDTTISQLFKQQDEEEDMQTLEEDVTRPDGRTTKVTTTREEGESEADFVARHDAVVAALQGCSSRVVHPTLSRCGRSTASTPTSAVAARRGPWSTRPAMTSASRSS